MELESQVSDSLKKQNVIPGITVSPVFRLEDKKQGSFTLKLKYYIFYSVRYFHTNNTYLYLKHLFPVTGHIVSLLVEVSIMKELHPVRKLKERVKH